MATANINIQIDSTLKQEAEALFDSLGMDIATAVRIFLNASIEQNGIPFSVRQETVPPSLQEAVFDSRRRQNLSGPFGSAEEAVASMLED